MHKSLQQFLFANCQSISSLLSQFILGVCAAAEGRKSQQKPLYFGSSGAFKVINVDTTETLVTTACCGMQHVRAYLQPFSLKTGQQLKR